METGTSTPKCFGLRWSSSDKICAGGLDPDYTDPETDSHIRPKCDFYATCMNRVRLKQQEELRSRSLPVLPSNPITMTRPSAPVSPRPEMTAQQMMQQLIQQKEASTAGPLMQPVMWPVESAIPVNYKMPNYLTVPEEREPGESAWSVLGREILRSAAKAVGHAVAAFFDRTRLRDKRYDRERSD